MNCVGPLASTEYGVASPFQATATVIDQLVEQKYMVVKEQERYVGVLTLSDVVARPHSLIIDCLSEKPSVDYDESLEQALSTMRQHALDLLPVFRVSHFEGVVTLNAILDLVQARALRFQTRLAEIESRDGKLFAVAGVAHDFNNILATLLGAVTLLQLRAEADVTSAGLLAEMEASIVTARDLARSLVSGFQGPRSPEIGAQSVADVVSEGVTFYLKGGPVTAQIAHPEELWAVQIPAGPLFRVVGNLVTNACQAMPDGGILDVTVTNVVVTPGDLAYPLPAGRYVEIAVADGGVGFDETRLPELFEPTFTTKPAGSGMGLAIVKEIVGRYNGYIALRSTPDVGTTARVWFPATPCTN